MVATLKKRVSSVLKAMLIDTVFASHDKAPLAVNDMTQCFSAPLAAATIATASPFRSTAQSRIWRLSAWHLTTR